MSGCKDVGQVIVTGHRKQRGEPRRCVSRANAYTSGDSHSALVRQWCAHTMRMLQPTSKKNQMFCPKSEPSWASYTPPRSAASAMAAKMAVAVAAAVAVTAVAAGDRRNWTVAAVAAVPERGVLRRGRERGHRGAGVDGCARGSGVRPTSGRAGRVRRWGMSGSVHSAGN
jgi:hypothetical protein